MTIAVVPLLVTLVIIGLVAWAIRAIISGFSIPAPIGTVIWVAFVIVVVLWLLSALGVSAGPAIRFR